MPLIWYFGGLMLTSKVCLIVASSIDATSGAPEAAFCIPHTANTKTQQVLPLKSVESGGKGRRAERTMTRALEKGNACAVGTPRRGS